MLRQTLVYVGEDVYTHNLRLGKQITESLEDLSLSTECIAGVDRRFARKEYSAIHILQLDLDPVNGITNVVRNDYFENPLKTKIIINGSKESTAPKAKKVIAADPFGSFNWISAPTSETTS